MAEAATIATGKHPDNPWRPLLHRWFVEYNPCYLLSAAMVLAGLLLLSAGLAHDESALGRLGVTAIAELYAVALIGSTALLARIGQQRSAVMLAVLAMFYQGDLTLHTDTAPDLGPLGAVTSAAWLALFLAKLSALAWAMKLRLSREAAAAAALGAGGLALLPFVLDHAGRHGAPALVMLWLFALSALQGRGVISSRAPLDEWGGTVLRRAVGLTWLFFAAQLAFHLRFWAEQGHVDVALFLPLALLVGTRWASSERATWALVSMTLLLVGALLPHLLSSTALVAAAVLALRGLDRWLARRSVQVQDSPGTAPYRAESVATPSEPDEDTSSPARWFLGAALSLHLSLWTLGWSAGPFPSHVLPLDLLFSLLLAAAAFRFRMPLLLLPLVGLWSHATWQARLIPVPRTLMQWGGASIGTGFALLLASLGVSYWLRPRPAELDSPRS